jgi:HEAT repeat protein
MNRPAKKRLTLLIALACIAAGSAGCRGYGPPPGEKYATLTFGRRTASSLEGLLSPSADERRWSVILLSQSGDPEMLDALIPMMNPRIEPIPLVRAETAKGMRVMGDKRALPALLNAALDLEAIVRAEAVRSLGALGGENELPRLIQLLRADHDDNVRLESAYALRRIGGAKALPALAYALDDPNESVIFAAHEALVALTGQELPPSRRTWESWIAAHSAGA